MAEDRSPETGARDQNAAAGEERGDEAPEDENGRQRGFLARLLGLSNGHEVGAAETAETANERALLTNVRMMRGQRVDDIMIPRADIVAVEVNASLAELTDAFRAGAHSRLPVYRETLDDPVGFVHVKDVALARGFAGGDAAEAEAAKPFRLEDIIRQMLVVPPSMLSGRLLQRMQQRRIHMALVVDEYGGVDGLVTIEDLVEQIVGDIEDEHDEADEEAWRREAPGVYAANARAELSDFEAEARVDLLPDDLDEEVDTLGGLVFMLSNRVPERGEVIRHPDGHEFEVIDADPRRIKRLRVRLFDAERAATEAAE
ncbi:HlyC/CorC family transporter [Pikeienuella piscinae]|uniref:HlyC/CorC family transporter n=1 Tax=Pikeienuella piscinae TaxID=2748098 RepID=A0A7M3T5G3_9RHOB|nr:hemolysin family protein [Pikeienuella piscinae]QIE57244.1 HlyC/CorC family transporter [Pikeienuella piscinae]